MEMKNNFTMYDLFSGDSIIIDTEDEDGVTLFFKDIIFAEERSWV